MLVGRRECWGAAARLPSRPPGLITLRSGLPSCTASGGPRLRYTTVHSGLHQTGCVYCTLVYCTVLYCTRLRCAASGCTWCISLSWKAALLQSGIVPWLVYQRLPECSMQSAKAGGTRHRAFLNVLFSTMWHCRSGEARKTAPDVPSVVLCYAFVLYCAVLFGTVNSGEERSTAYHHSFCV